MKRALRIGAPILGLVFALAGAPASAASIDFTNRVPWGAADNQTTFTSGFTTLTASASGTGSVALRFNSPGTCTGAVPALACNGDGIGIYAPTTIPFAGNVDLSTEIDRVGRNELLTVSFANPLHITSIEVLNLFAVSIPLTQLVLTEQFEVSVNGGAFTAYGAPTTSTGSGYLLQALDANGVTSLAFRSPSANVLGNFSDFTLARINYLPEPGAIGLFAAGALGLAASRRRRRA